MGKRATIAWYRLDRRRDHLCRDLSTANESEVRVRVNESMVRVRVDEKFCPMTARVNPSGNAVPSRNVALVLAKKPLVETGHSPCIFHYHHSPKGNNIPPRCQDEYCGGQ